MKGVAGKLRIELAQYAELATFAQFGTSDLDAATRRQLERGQRSVEVLKQGQNVPLRMEQQVVIMYALVNGFIDDVPIAKVSEFEENLHKFIDSNNPEILQTIASEKNIVDSAALDACITEFKKGFEA